MLALRIARFALNRQYTQASKRQIILNSSRFKSITATAPKSPIITSTEQEFLEVKLKHDPDKFGDDPEPETVDPGDLQEQKYSEEQPLPSKKLRTKQYAEIIKSHLKNRKIKEAIDVLEERMLKEDRVKPENYIYNLIIGGLGRVGYTKKAFALYNDMKKRGLKVTGGTYTALFNACANSPWIEDGLSRAQKLQSIMIEKMYEPNDSNYNAMIKAFGRCGDLETAFRIVDEMVKKRFRIKDDTINFLLQACISDKNAGFRHSLLVWRKMVKKNIKPSLFTYNLLLKSVKDCGIGDLQTINEALDRILKVQNSKQASSKLLLTSPNSSNEDTNKLIIDSSSASLVDTNQNQSLDISRPNLLSKNPHLGNIISLSEITRAEDRLLLLGGMRGFLKNMEENECLPDIKTYTQLLDCLPQNLESEKELLGAMKKQGLRPDLDFYNMLIKKRSMRFDYESARDVLKLIKKSRFMPDLVTYGVLALGCKTKEEALGLIEEMKEHSYRLNTEILGAMLCQACYHKNFSYVLEIMEISKREDIKPNKKFLEHLEKFKKTCKAISNDKEHKLSQSKSFLSGFRVFSLRYKVWLQEMGVDDGEVVHPWTQYRQNSETDSGKFRDKSVRFKARRASLFKVKTSTKQRRQ